MIHDEKKLILVHIPRTAGSSIVQCVRGKRAGHATARDLEKRQVVKWNTYTRVAVVRNPWSRLVSLYHSLLPLWVDKLSFRQFVDSVCSDNPDGVLSMVDSLLDSTGSMRVEILRFERLEEDWAKFAEKHSLDATLPHVKKQTYDRNLDSWYDPELALKVEARFKSDIDAFHYTYETSRDQENHVKVGKTRREVLENKLENKSQNKLYIKPPARQMWLDIPDKSPAFEKHPVDVVASLPEALAPADKLDSKISNSARRSVRGKYRAKIAASWNNK